MKYTSLFCTGMLVSSGIIFLFSFFGCNTVSEIDFPLEYEGDRIVIISQLEDSHEIYIQLYKTSPPLDSFYLDSFYITNATITLFEDGTAYPFIHLSNGKYTSPEQKQAKSGRTYRIEASAPGFPSAFSADEIVPFSGSIMNATWTTIESTNQYDGIVSFDVEIPDNFPFDIVFTGIADGEETSPEYDIVAGIGFFCENVILVPECLTEGGHIEALVNKEYFNGNETLINTHIKIRLVILSPSQKSYEESITLQEDAFSYPFIGKDSPYTNIQNGYGLLSSSAETEIIIPIQ